MSEGGGESAHGDHRQRMGAPDRDSCPSDLASIRCMAHGLYLHWIYIGTNQW